MDFKDMNTNLNSSIGMSKILFKECQVKDTNRYAQIKGTSHF